MIDVLTDVVIEGGGSTTRVGLAVDGRLVDQTVMPSINGYSVGQETARSTLERALQWAVAAVPEGAKVRTVVLATSSVGNQATLCETADVTRALANELSPLSSAAWVVTNDVVPLLCDHRGEVAVVVCGTGTAYVARGLDGSLAHASGREYLLSDEGGGFDIGLQGMRAVVREADGRGAATALTASATSIMGAVRELRSELLNRQDVKPFVASFAREVLQAAAVGDAVASMIVDRAADELRLGIEAVVRRAVLSGPVNVLMSGSLLVGDHHSLRDALFRQLSHEYLLKPVTHSPLELVAIFSDALHVGRLNIDAVKEVFPLAVLQHGADTSLTTFPGLSLEQ